MYGFALGLGSGPGYNVVDIGYTLVMKHHTRWWTACNKDTSSATELFPNLSDIIEIILWPAFCKYLISVTAVYNLAPSEL